MLYFLITFTSLMDVVRAQILLMIFLLSGTAEGSSKVRFTFGIGSNCGEWEQAHLRIRSHAAGKVRIDGGTEYQISFLHMWF